MNCFRYKIEHDWGFAPNPFHGTLSLATCKADIRGCKNLEIGDWVVGFGSKSMDNLGKLIFAMKVEEILTLTNIMKILAFNAKSQSKQGLLSRCMVIIFIIQISQNILKDNSFKIKELTAIRIGAFTKNTMIEILRVIKSCYPSVSIILETRVLRFQKNLATYV